MSNVKEILKSIGGELRKAQNNLFSRKFADASEIVKTLEMLLEDAVALEPDNVQVKTFTNQVAKLKKDLDQRMGKADPAAAAPEPAPTAPRAQTGASSPAKSAQPPVPSAQPARGLPAGVLKRIRDMHDLLRRGKPQDALGLLKEIDNQYAGQFDTDHPEYLDVKQKAESAVAGIDAQRKQAQADKERLDGEREERERVSVEWEKRLKSLEPFGMQTSDIQNLLVQKQVFEDAQNVFAEYRETAFPFGKTHGLEQAEHTVSERIRSFPDFWESARRAALDEAVAHLDSRRSNLDKIIEDKPLFMNDDSIRQTETLLDSFLPLFPEGTEENKHIRGLFEALLEKNRVNREERARQIFMREDVYQGEDADAIRTRMEHFISKADPDANIIRTCIYRPEWKELSQWEDYAGNKRFVTRGEIYGQVLAEVQGTPKLFTVYITKEKKSDGTWTQLTGNVMFSDDIARENM